MAACSPGHSFLECGTKRADESLSVGRGCGAAPGCGFQFNFLRKPAPLHRSTHRIGVSRGGSVLARKVHLRVRPEFSSATIFYNHRRAKTVS